MKRNPLFLILAFCCLASINMFAQTKELNRLADDTRKAIKKGRINEADSLAQKYRHDMKEGAFGGNFEYSEIISWLAQRRAGQGRIGEAIELQNEVIEVRKKAPDCTYAQWAAATSDLASLYARKGDYSQAIEIGNQALEMLLQKFGEKHNYYCIAQANQAGYYAARGLEGDYQQAIGLGEQAVKNMKKGTIEYANALNALVVFYSQDGNRISSNKLLKKALKEARKRFEKDKISGANVLNNNAIRLSKIGDYEQALEYIETAKEYYEAEGRTKTLAYGKILVNMATFHTHLYKYQQAAELLEQALPIIESTATKKSPDYIRCTSELSAAYQGLGNLEKANEYAHESDKLSRSVDGQDNIKYAKSLSKQAYTFASNGNYPRAIEHERKALDVYVHRKDSNNIAYSLGVLASYQFSNGDKEQALATVEQSLDIFRKRGRASFNYAQALNSSAVLYYNASNFDLATRYGQQALRMYEELGDTASAIYARIMANNALFEFVRDSVQQAIETAQKAVDLHQRILDINHPENVPLLYNLAVYQMKAGQKEEACQNFQKALSVQSEQVRTNFLHLTSQERESFWEQKDFVFRSAPMMAYLNRDASADNSMMTTEAYNSILFTKGLLLNSDIDFKNLLKRTGDKTLLEKYTQLELLKQNKNDYYKLPVGQRDETELKQINEDIYQLERALVRGCKEFGSFTENLSITTSQVRESLKDNEAAIEFTDIYIQGMGTTYLALLLRKDSDSPQLIRLFSDADLKDISYQGMTFEQALKDEAGINHIYNDPRFGSLLWQPIMRHLQGVNTIYFSPSNMFYQVGIEYLPCDAQHRIGDLYDLYRLSSTKSLAQRKPADKIRSAVIYGGLVYDMDEAQLQEQHDKLLSEHPQDPTLLAYENVDAPEYVAGMQRTLDSLSVRGSVHYLPGTRREASFIADQLFQNGIEPQVFMENSGIEETFKRLGGTSPSIIHIATHGFSFSRNQIKERKDQFVFLNEQTDNLDNMLNYSGLLMSGANYRLRGNKLPKDLEDGILTAREIAQVDLGNVGLVVLSACQTALGEVRSDGVFGIQRSFKKAGAHSLLMSLWPVSDQATELMMTYFYKYLMEGKTRQQAFKMAQKSIQDEHFTDPVFWASFILLDGI